MKTAMVDTQVLVYGTVGGGPKPSEKVTTRVAESRAIMMQLEIIHVATITLVEFLPWVDLVNDQRARSVMERFQRHAFDTAAEVLASRIIRELNNDPKRCTSCLGPKEPVPPCSACGNGKARAQRQNDYYIAATAATTYGVEVLYTYDRGIHHVARMPGNLLGRLEVLEPPPIGGALEAAARAREAALAPIEPAAEKVPETGEASWKID